jgi:hypothetical protein
MLVRYEFKRKIELDSPLAGGLPERFGPFTTRCSRLVRWRQAGVWTKIMNALAAAHGVVGWLVRGFNIHPKISDIWLGPGNALIRIACRLHVVVDAALACSLEQGKSPIVCVEHHSRMLFVRAYPRETQE